MMKILAMKPPPVSLIEVYWPIDNALYPGTVSTIGHDNLTTVQYHDGEIERNLNKNKDVWRFANSDLQESMKTCILSSIEKHVRDEILVHFGNKPFYLISRSGFLSFQLSMLT